MSDFILDFRNPQERFGTDMATELRHYPDLWMWSHDWTECRLAVCRPDSASLWEPCTSPDGSVSVALCGRIALDEKDWRKADGLPGSGGVACKHILNMYLTDGVKVLATLNGGYVVVVVDLRTKRALVATDRCGMYPCFVAEGRNGNPVFCSHPDTLARVTQTITDHDDTSLSEFLLTGSVSYPYTYYRMVRSVDFASVHDVDMRNLDRIRFASRRSFSFSYKPDSRMDQWALAEELSFAFRNSVKRRTLPRFGKSVVALSGGLDSRMLVCASDNRERIEAFCFFDRRNYELNTAVKIAAAAGVKLHLLQRGPDHYAANARKGVAISGGMGSFVNNHFLGFREQFKTLGFENILTGFYCDYLFKGLALNIATHRYLRTERIAQFNQQWYRPVYQFPGCALANHVLERMEERYPARIREDRSCIGPLLAEERRIFPLCYEPDNAETTVSQRVFGWYLPILDSEVLDVYQRIPVEQKLNCAMYAKSVKLTCGKLISRIPDTNTGAPVGAPWLVRVSNWYRRAAAIRDSYIHRLSLVAQDADVLVGELSRCNRTCC